MPTYVQAPGSDNWHWCTNCPNYPKNPAKKETHPGKERPRGDLCNICKDWERDGTCAS